MTNKATPQQGSKGLESLKERIYDSHLDLRGGEGARRIYLERILKKESLLSHETRAAVYSILGDIHSRGRYYDTESASYYYQKSGEFKKAREKAEEAQQYLDDISASMKFLKGVAFAHG